jgi:hypothetical protein
MQPHRKHYSLGGCSTSSAAASCIVPHMITMWLVPNMHSGWHSSSGARQPLCLACHVGCSVSDCCKLTGAHGHSQWLPQPCMWLPQPYVAHQARPSIPSRWLEFVLVYVAVVSCMLPAVSWDVVGTSSPVALSRSCSAQWRVFLDLPHTFVFFLTEHGAFSSVGSL